MKRAMIKCVDNGVYTGIIVTNNDISLVLKGVNCKNVPYDAKPSVIGEPNVYYDGEVEFMWDKIIWVSYQ